MFFDTASSDAVLSDSNAELMSCFEVVRDAPEDLIHELSHDTVGDLSSRSRAVAARGCVSEGCASFQLRQ